MKRRDRVRQAQRLGEVRYLDFIGITDGAWITHGDDILFGMQIVTAGSVRVIARGAGWVFSMDDLAELRAAIVVGADYVLARLRLTNIIPPDELGECTGEVFGQAWDRHRRIWLRENGV